MLRIIHFDTGHELRGGQRQLLLLAHGLRDRGHEQLIACQEGGELERRARRDGFPAITLRRRHTGMMTVLEELRRQFVRGGFQVLHAHDGRGQTLSALSSLGLPVKRVATRRVTFMPRRLGRTVGLHRLQYGPACDAIVAVSRFVRDLLVSSGIDATKVQVIPDGIEIPAELPDATCRARVRKLWDLDPEAFVLGHAGAFTHEKGQDVLLEAFLRSMPAGARLLLAGDGPRHAAGPITELISKAQGRARALGWIDDLMPFFAALDLYVMPSRAEGLGSSALLAMAYGLPVVASRVGGLPEVVEDGHTGWLVPPDSPRDLADALAEAASDRGRLRQFGVNARTSAHAFSSDIMVGHTEALYRRLTSPLLFAE